MTMKMASGISPMLSNMFVSGQLMGSTAAAKKNAAATSARAETANLRERGMCDIAVRLPA